MQDIDQYRRYRAYRMRTAPVSGRQLGNGTAGNGFGLGAFAENTELADSVAALIQQINAWSAGEANRVRDYVGQLDGLSQALSGFLAIPAIQEAFGQAIAAIVGQLTTERNRANTYLATLG